MRARTRSMYSKLLALCFSSSPTCTKAVCWPELEVYMDEKPGVTPMFATTTLSSEAGTTWCTICSTLPTRSCVSLEGASPSAP